MFRLHFRNIKVQKIDACGFTSFDYYDLQKMVNLGFI